MRTASIVMCTLCVALVHGVSMMDEAAVDSEAVDLGEAATGRHVEYRFQQDKEQDNLGESAQGHADHPAGQTGEMIEFGDLLARLPASSQHGEAINSLNQALKTKVLMDQLHRDAGSFSKTKHGELGESHGSKAGGKSFMRLLHSHTKDMVDITKYLLERKKEGNPLTSKEDSQLQKYYYNRASTILKKIVLLKKGEKAPSPSSDLKDEISRGSAGAEVAADTNKADAVVERLRFDAKVANANAAYNKKMMQAQQHRIKAAEFRRKEAAKESLEASQQKLAYDERVANAEAKYNEALSTELLVKKHEAEEKVKKAEADKLAADKASAKATSDANEADREAARAVKEAEKASAQAQQLELEDTSKKHRLRAHKKEPAHIPLSVTPHAHLQSLLRYLQTAVNKHAKVSPAELQLMQGFFLKRGSALLSQIAQVDPDATWHSKGVVSEEQYEMDQKRPNRVSQEWGSKNLKGETVMKDFMADVLSHHQSQTRLKRPGVEHAQGIFGSNAKLPLHFAADTSKPVMQEPAITSDLGESSDEDEEQTPHRQAWSGMMGISEDEQA